MNNPKKLLFSFVLIFIFLESSNATTKDSILSSRGFHQQMFLVEYIKQNEPTTGFETDTDVLNFLQNSSKKWVSLVPNQSESYKRMDIYSIMWATEKLFKNKLPLNSKCLIYSKIALPSFISDIEYLKEKLKSNNSNTINAANLIRMSSLTWATNQPPTFNCELKYEQWKKSTKLIYEYPDIIQEYLDSDLVKNSITESKYKTLKRVHLSAKSIIPILKLQDKLYENKLDELFGDLNSRIDNSGDDLYMYVLIGKNLFEKYLNNLQIDKAYAVLDLLAKNTSNNSLSRIELKELYAKVAKEEGLQRFNDIAKKKEILILSNLHKDLDLKLFDATNNEYFSNIKFKNKLIILDFWSVGCGPCIKKIPNLNLLYEKNKDYVTLISINSDLKLKLEELQKFIKNKGINYPVLVDSNQANLMKKFNVTGWPAYFLIDSNGFFFKEPIENRIKLSLDEIEEYLNK